MTSNLSLIALHKLAEELTLPNLVAEILKQDQINDDHIMLIANLIEDMSSDRLLLSMACSLRLIAEHKQDSEPEIAKALFYHAEFILDDYAPYWTSRKTDSVIFPAEWSHHIEEDLELIYDLMIVTRDAFTYRDDTVYTLTEMIADYMKHTIESLHNKKETEIYIEPSLKDREYPQSEVMSISSNIIMFPMDRVKLSQSPLTQ
jgi:hypothetical protein